jgi:hypothetical protein
MLLTFPPLIKSTRCPDLSIPNEDISSLTPTFDLRRFWQTKSRSEGRSQRLRPLLQCDGSLALVLIGRWFHCLLAESGFRIVEHRIFDLLIQVK